MATVEVTHQFRHRRTRPTRDGCPTFPIHLCVLLDDGTLKMVSRLNPLCIPAPDCFFNLFNITSHLGNYEEISLLFDLYS
jgi:hypothetical protein